MDGVYNFILELKLTCSIYCNQNKIVYLLPHTWVACSNLRFN